MFFLLLVFQQFFNSDRQKKNDTVKFPSTLLSSTDNDTVLILSGLQVFLLKKTSQHFTSAETSKANLRDTTKLSQDLKECTALSCG